MTPVCPNKRPVWLWGPSVVLSQGSRGLQQSAATLTGSLKLIGFDIKNYHKQHFQKVHARRWGFYEKIPPSLLFFSLSPASLHLSFSSNSDLWNLCSCFQLSLSVRLCVSFFCQDMTMASKNISHASLRQLIMYHLLFICLIENAAGLALCVLSVLSATSPPFTATFGIIVPFKHSKKNW